MEARFPERTESWRVRPPTLPSFVSARCAWSRRSVPTTQPSRPRWRQSQPGWRSARRRRCGAGSARPKSTPASGPASRPGTLRRASGCGRRTPSCDGHRLPNAVTPAGEVGQTETGPPCTSSVSWPFTKEICTVARLPGRERGPRDRTPPAHTLTLIGYTKPRDAIRHGAWCPPSRSRSCPRPGRTPRRRRRAAVPGAGSRSRPGPSGRAPSRPGRRRPGRVRSRSPARPSSRSSDASATAHWTLRSPFHARCHSAIHPRTSSSESAARACHWCISGSWKTAWTAVASPVRHGTQQQSVAGGQGGLRGSGEGAVGEDRSSQVGHRLHPANAPDRVPAPFRRRRPAFGPRPCPYAGR